MKTLTVEAHINNLSKVLDFIDSELDNSSCSRKTLMQINIAVEELFANVASYAYPMRTGGISIDVEVESDPGKVTITFTDSGIPYNPLLREDPDITLPAEERSIGGLGVFIVKETMDSMTYERKDDHNIVTISKHF